MKCRPSLRAAGAVALGGAALVALRALKRSRSREDLTGQVAIVTGSSRGLGFLLARELAREGCRVVICARTASDLERAKRELEAEGAEVLARVCDVADREAVEALVRATVERFGGVDILVNNAGIIAVGPIESMKYEYFHDLIDVMFWGVVHATLAVLPLMRRAGGGRIVNITSIGGKRSVPHLVAYGAAKYAAVGFSEALHAELAEEGITVTTIVPGLMRTGSYLNAYFTGDPRGEFTWFSLGSSLPLISMDAERAARIIIDAAKRREREKVLTLQARAAVWFHGLFPGAMSAIFSGANRLLPSGTVKQRIRGQDVARDLDSKALRLATTLGRRAARRFQWIDRPG